tara:strand:+ start:10696 stop:12429 length:1734 start_codon:yes stop_codon:yes gene_type:complete
MAKVLLVEDQMLFAKVQQMELETYDYQVSLAHSGREAIHQAIEDQGIDVILMDIDLGAEMDGTDAAKEILSKREIPIVFYSNHTSKDVVEKTEKISSYGYVVKNSGITVLDASIKMALKLYHQKKAIEEKDLLLTSITDNYPNAYISVIKNDLTVDFTAGGGFKAQGLEPATYFGKHISEIFGPYAPEIERHYRKVFDGTPVDFEINFGGTYLLFKCSPLPTNKEKTERIVVSVMDVTSYHNAIRDIEIKTEMLNSIAQSVVSIDMQGIVTYWNKGSEELYGWTNKEALGRHILELSPIKSQHQSQEMLNALFAGKKWEGEYLVYNKDGVEFMVQSINSPIFHEGVQTGVIGISSSLERRLKIERELEKANNEVTTLLHELQHRAKNSFTLISSMIMLEEINSPDGVCKKLLSRLNRRVMAISDMYELLQKNETSNRVRLDEYLVELVHLIENADLSQKIEIETIPVEAKLEVALPIGICVVELVTNAMKYAYQGSKQGVISFSIYNQNDHLAITVYDEGVGFDDESDDSSGTSGLSLIKAFMHQLNGSFKITNKKGTRCEILVPNDQHNLTFKSSK